MNAGGSRSAPKNAGRTSCSPLRVLFVHESGRLSKWVCFSLMPGVFLQGFLACASSEFRDRRVQAPEIVGHQSLQTCSLPASRGPCEEGNTDLLRVSTTCWLCRSRSALLNMRNVYTHVHKIQVCLHPTSGRRGCPRAAQQLREASKPGTALFIWSVRGVL